MHAITQFTRNLAAATLLGSALLVAVPLDTFADPPPWAPAHGWRKKNDPYYVGYTGRKWDRDYDIISGRCNREAVGAVLGGVVGGAVGSQIGRGSGRQIATVVGAIAGAVIGAQIGRDMDRTDYACFGHALELANPNQRVTWPSADHRTTYVLTPLAGYQQNGRSCRKFSLQTTRGRRTENGTGRACQGAQGTWEIVG